MNVKTAVFPVAGFGTRMLPATKAIPKEMITLIDKPLIQYAVEEAIDSGIERIIFITGRTKKALEDHFDINIELNKQLENSGKHQLLEDMKKISEMVDVIYVRQKYMNGLGDAITCVKDIVKDEPFAVILPDDIILSKEPVTKQLINKFNNVKKPIVSLMKVPISETNKYGIVQIRETVSDNFFKIGHLQEKPKENPYSDMAVIGRYILTSEVMDALSNVKAGTGNEVQLTDALEYVANNSCVYGYEFEGSRFDCGNKQGLFAATLNYAFNDDKLREVFKEEYNKLFK